MKTLLKHAFGTLPLMVVVSIVGWMFFGGLIGSEAGADDQMLWLAELPVATAWALAVLVSAAFAMEVTGMNLANDYRCQLYRRAAEGDHAAYRTLVLESACWFLMLCVAAAIFWVVRR